MSYILIIGAKSDIARATALEYANNGYDLYLAARNSNELKKFADDIKVRTQRTVHLIELDILDYKSHQTFYDSLEIEPLGVLSAIGYLGKQEKSEIDLNETLQVINTNFTGIVSLFNIIANSFEKRKSGFIIGICSVAGDRGRKSNYIYGSAKAAMSTYLSGLRNRLNDAHVHVMTVKPGFVNTKMTEGMNLPQKMTVQPEDVAKDIYKAQQRGKNVLYTKWIWRYVMIIIRMIPEWKFKSMNI